MVYLQMGDGMSRPNAILQSECHANILLSDQNGGVVRMIQPPSSNWRFKSVHFYRLPHSWTPSFEGRETPISANRDNDNSTS